MTAGLRDEDLENETGQGVSSQRVVHREPEMHAHLLEIADGDWVACHRIDEVRAAFRDLAKSL